MTMTITCQGFEGGDAFKKYIEDSLLVIINKYAIHYDSLHVHATRVSSGFQAHLKLHIPKQDLIQTDDVGDTVHKAFDAALNNMVKKIRRFKRYRDDYQRGHTSR